jgi:hypothetical protein
MEKTAKTRKKAALEGGLLHGIGQIPLPPIFLLTNTPRGYILNPSTKEERVHELL